MARLTPIPNTSIVHNTISWEGYSACCLGFNGTEKDNEVKGKGNSLDLALGFMRVGYAGGGGAWPS